MSEQFIVGVAVGMVVMGWLDRTVLTTLAHRMVRTRAPIWTSRRRPDGR